MKNVIFISKKKYRIEMNNYAKKHKNSAFKCKIYVLTYDDYLTKITQWFNRIC